MSRILRFFLASTVFAIHSTAVSAPQNRAATELESTNGTKQNLIHTWAGLGAGLSYHRIVANHVALGVSASTQSSADTNVQNSFLVNNNEYEYKYEAKFSVVTTSAMAQALWLSSDNDGFMLGALLGVTHVEAAVTGNRTYKNISTLGDAIETTSLAQTKNTFAPSLGIQLGYIWTFENGFTLGIQSQLIASQARASNFSAYTAASSDARFYDSLEADINSKITPSNLGLLMGFAF